VSTCIHEPTTGAIRPEKDGVGVVGMRGRNCEGRARPLMRTGLYTSTYRARLSRPCG
jgi:hypothetical protein